MPLPMIMDAAVALVAEGYQAIGADWWDALEKAQNAGDQKPPEEKREKTDAEKAAENQATMASIMSGLGGSSFRGPKG